MFKYIFLVLFFVLTGFKFLGLLTGYLFGLLIDALIYLFSPARESPEASYEYYKKRVSVDDFTRMLMVMTAAVMRADGKARKIELEYVKDFFRRNLGESFRVEHLQMLKHFLQTPGIPLAKICADIRSHTVTEERILILHYLFGIAAADDKITQSEVNIIYEISNLLGLREDDFQTVMNMFVRIETSDYKILGIEKLATNEEVKKAYRELALRYHPDRVAHMGEEHQKNAKEQFQKIQQAYEKIKKERGMV